MSPADQAAVDAAIEVLAEYMLMPLERAERITALAASVSGAAHTLERYAAAGRPTSRVRCALELLTGVLRDATERTP